MPNKSRLATIVDIVENFADESWRYKSPESTTVDILREVMKEAEDSETLDDFKLFMYSMIDELTLTIRK